MEELTRTEGQMTSSDRLAYIMNHNQQSTTAIQSSVGVGVGVGVGSPNMGGAINSGNSDMEQSMQAMALSSQRGLPLPMATDTSMSHLPMSTHYHNAGTETEMDTLGMEDTQMALLQLSQEFKPMSVSNRAVSDGRTVSQQHHKRASTFQPGGFVRSRANTATALGGGAGYDSGMSFINMSVFFLCVLGGFMCVWWYFVKKTICRKKMGV